MSGGSDVARFDGRVAIVTGAGGGLGRAYAVLLGERGASVVVNDVGGFDDVVQRELGNAEAVAAEIRAAGGTAVAATASITTAAGVDSVVRAALDTYGRIDIVVNNAGILRSCDFGEMTEDLWDAVVDVSLRGAFLMTRAVWSTMTAQGYGRIVSATSNSALLGIAGSSAYAAAKGGIYGLTRVLALEGEELGIRANAIAPVAFTGMSKQSRVAPAAWKDGTGDDWSRRLDPALVAPVVGYLAHEDCTLNGEVLSSIGGRAARFFMGLTQGWIDDALDIESVRDHLDEVVDEDGYEVLPRAFEEGRRLRRRLLG